jgi:recombinational DNA repair protein RecR
MALLRFIIGSKGATILVSCACKIILSIPDPLNFLKNLLFFMQGLLNYKPIQESIIFHATPNEYGQFLLVSRNIMKFTKVIDMLKEYLRAIRYEGYYLKFVKHQTDQICLEAVRQNGWALQFVRHQTEEICIEAVKRDGWALQFVNHQTDPICLDSVKQEGSALQFVKHQTDQLCLEAVKQNGTALRFVKHQTKEICVEAVKQHEWAWDFVEIHLQIK